MRRFVSGFREGDGEGSEGDGEGIDADIAAIEADITWMLDELVPASKLKERLGLTYGCTAWYQAWLQGLVSAPLGHLRRCAAILAWLMNALKALAEFNMTMKRWYEDVNMKRADLAELMLYVEWCLHSSESSDDLLYTYVLPPTPSWDKAAPTNKNACAVACLVVFLLDACLLHGGRRRSGGGFS